MKFLYIVSLVLFGSATILPYFLHLVTSNGSYKGNKKWRAWVFV